MKGSLGELEQLLLFALLHLGDDAYGVAIRELIRDRTGRTLAPGAIYTALDRLEQRGLVRSRLGDPTPERGGKRKRYYRAQPAGVAALERTRDAAAAMALGLDPRFQR
jgi:DNA-binding PadR family transcriptional regulator